MHNKNHKAYRGNGVKGTTLKTSSVSPMEACKNCSTILYLVVKTYITKINVVLYLEKDLYLEAGQERAVLERRRNQRCPQRTKLPQDLWGPDGVCLLCPAVR